MRIGFLTLVIWLFGGVPISAQPVITMKLKPGSLDVLVPIAAHQSRCVALNENLGLLAFGHERTYPDAQVTLVKLDAKGQPAAFGMPIKLPCPDPLLKFGHYPSALAFHPKLPLLYVWQDVNFPHNISVPAKPPEVVPFDHLVIYDVSKETPRLVAALCRGDQYLYAMQGGALTIDPEGSSLLIPNFRDLKNTSFWHLGRFLLDADGLPKVLPKDLPLPDRLKELARVNDSQALVPAERTPVEYVNIFPLNFHGTVHSAQALSRDVILAGGINGLMSWRPGDKVMNLNHVYLKKHAASLLALHPKLPAVFVTKANTDSLLRLEQVEGNLTSLPRQYVFPDAVLTSPPAVLPRHNLVAVGGQHQVYLVPLDAEAHPGADASVARVLNPAVKAMVYSEKFDRLYVGVDLSK